MPGGPMHMLITRCALDALMPAAQAAFGTHAAALGTQYCLNPDTYYSLMETSSPYVVYVEHRQFHYLPREPVEYDWIVTNVHGKTELAPEPFTENKHHTHCRDGFRQYFTQIPAAIRDGRQEEAAQLTGSLLHMLEDGTIPPHALEGPDGTDFFLLNRLLTPPSDRPFLTPTTVLAQVEPIDPGPLAHKPRLLGLTPEEASFHLYTRFCETVLANRLHAVPFAQAVYDGREAEVADRTRTMIRASTALCIDVLHTLTTQAKGGAPFNEAAGLAHVDLSAMRPARRPHSLSGPYRNLGVVRGFSLDDRLQPVPLKLAFPGEERKTYAQGLGMGAHLYFGLEYALPPGLYRRLTGSAGLHPELGRKGHVRLQWLLDERVIWEAEFQGAKDARNFDIDVSAGGWLRLQGQALTASFGDPANQVVIAEPELIRASIEGAGRK